MRLDEGKRKLLAAGALGLFVLASAIGGWGYLAGDRHATERLYEMRRLGPGDVERSVSASGAVKALVTVDVGSQVSGPITEMKADFNSSVKQGDLLAVIDRAPFEAKVEAARANLAIARAEVDRREAGITKIRRQLGLIDRDVGRYRMLASSAGVSRQQLDQTETQSSATRHDLGAAQAELESAKASIVLRQADLTQAEINFARTLILSPIDGVVVDRRMQRGQTVTAEYQTPVLFQIAQDLSQILILAQVDEADIGAVHKDDRVTFSVEAFPDESFSGVVDQIRLAPTKTSGVVTYTVVIRARNPDRRLYPDMTATVRIVTARRGNVLNAPNEAFRFRPVGVAMDAAKTVAGRSQLWVFDAQNSMRVRSVRLGVKGDVTTEIIDGELLSDDRVILRARAPSPEAP